MMSGEKDRSDTVLCADCHSNTSSCTSPPVASTLPFATNPTTGLKIDRLKVEILYTCSNKGSSSSCIHLVTKSLTASFTSYTYIIILFLNKISTASNIQ